MAGSKGAKYYDIFLNYAIQLEHKAEGQVIDQYGFDLLVTIQETESLKLAADKMNVSYRKAWGDLEDIEKGLNIKLVERQRGGAQGGKTSLTDEGKNLIGAYKNLRKEFDKAIYSTTKKFFSSINE